MRSRKSKKRRTLVLNADYSAMALINWRRALVLTFKNQEDPMDGLQPVDYYKGFKVKSCGNQYFPVPSVVRSPQYIRPKGKKIPFSRKNLFLRDNLTCAYCGLQDTTTKNLTFDHIIPRAIWRRQNHNITPTSWKNIVTCCIACNRKKANKTPKQANMRLLYEPKEPNPHQYILGLSPWSRIHPTWEPYLPNFYKNLLKKVKNPV